MVLIRGTTFWQVGINAFTGCNSLQALYIERDASNFTGSNPTVGSSWTKFAGNSILMGKLYFYTTSANPSSANYSRYEGFLAGFWHYSDDTYKDIDHIEVVSGEPATATISTPTALAVGDKRKVA